MKAGRTRRRQRNRSDRVWQTAAGSQQPSTVHALPGGPVMLVSHAFPVCEYKFGV